MKAEFTAIIEPAPEGGYWAICPEVPGANGQGETVSEAKDNLRQAIELIAESGDRQTKVVLVQDNNPTESAREHSQRNWDAMLASLKKIVEQ